MSATQPSEGATSKLSNLRHVSALDSRLKALDSQSTNQQEASTSGAGGAADSPSDEEVDESQVAKLREQAATRRSERAK